MCWQWNEKKNGFDGVDGGGNDESDEKKIVCHVFIGSLFISRINPFSPCSLFYFFLFDVKSQYITVLVYVVLSTSSTEKKNFFANTKRKRITNKLDGLLLQYIFCCYYIIQCDIYMRISISLAHKYCFVCVCVFMFFIFNFTAYSVCKEKLNYCRDFCRFGDSKLYGRW